MSYYQYQAWQIKVKDKEHYDDLNLMQPEEDPSLCLVFSIEIFANIFSYEPTMAQQLLLPQRQLTSTHASSTSWWAISSKLSQMHVPFALHVTVTQRVIECVSSAVNEAHNKNRNNIPIVVTLCPVVRLSSEEKAVVPDEHVFQRRGASKGDIEALENVNGDFAGRCVICLDDILDGLKASFRMHCSHVYHQHCIVNWLEKSNFCPLCPFQMPL